MNTDLRFYVKHTPEVMEGSIYDVTVLQNICDYATLDGVFVIPNFEHFARMCHMTDRQVRRVIAKYRDLKYIRIVQKGGGRGNPTIYKLDVPRFMMESQENRMTFEKELMEARFSIEDFGIDKGQKNYDSQSQNKEDTMTGGHSLEPDTVTDGHSLSEPKKSMPYRKNINTSSRSSNKPKPIDQSQFPAASTAELPFEGIPDDTPQPPPLSACDWSFLNAQDRQEHLGAIKSAYQEFQGSLDMAGHNAFGKTRGGWNGMRMRSAIQVKSERSHEQAFAAIVIAGITGSSTLEKVVQFFNGTKQTKASRSYALPADIAEWRKSVAKGRPPEAYLEFRNGVSVNARLEYYNNGSTISEAEALALINDGLTPSPQQREEIQASKARSGGPKLRRDLGRGIQLDESANQYYASGKPVAAEYAHQILSM